VRRAVSRSSVLSSSDKDGKISLGMEEILVIDKPEGWTSHDVVSFYRKKLGIRKIGHAGTLDPFATGALILLVGDATKRFEEFKKLDKEYEMTVELGRATDTGDPDGEIVRELEPDEIKRLAIDRERIKRVLDGFLGEYEQEVPAYSAVKHKGKPLYKYARRGEKVELPRRLVRIRKIELLKFYKAGRYPRLKIRVVCSSGTYMRRLAEDVGRRLDLPAVAVELRRTRIGDYTLKDATSPEP